MSKKVNFTIEDNVVRSWKPKGMSPNEHLSLIKEELGFTGKSCYTGRLDPMASGQMIYLIDEMTKNRERYMNCDKTYTFYIVCGFSTDSLDCMGNVQEINLNYDKEMYDTMRKNIQSGKYLQYTQTMPSCSSYKAKSNVTGEKKPLWEWKLLNRLDEVDIPTKDIQLVSMETFGQTISSVDSYIDQICKDIRSVTSFPKDQLDPIIEKWQIIKDKNSDRKLRLIKCTATVPSGTFVRYLADMIGKDVGIPCHAFDITRTEFYL